MYLTSTLLVGCASVSVHNKVSDLKFSTILNFQIGATSQADVLSILGKPSDTKETDNYIIMNYNEPETAFQRLSVNINRHNKKVASLFWVPKEGDSESSLDYAKKSFENTDYKVTEEKIISNHTVSSGVLFYIDKKAGVTIRYDKRRDEVEAIALYDRENRIPSSTK